ALRATLDEVIEADLILHVRDIAHEDAQAQALDVEEVLGQLGIGRQDERRLIDIWNKIDCLDPDSKARIHNLAARQSAETRPILISALSGEGVDRLVAELEAGRCDRREALELLLRLSR